MIPTRIAASLVAEDSRLGFDLGLLAGLGKQKRSYEREVDTTVVSASSTPSISCTTKEKHCRYQAQPGTAPGSSFNTVSYILRLET